MKVFNYPYHLGRLDFVSSGHLKFRIQVTTTNGTVRFGTIFKKEFAINFQEPGRRYILGRVLAGPKYE